MLVGVFYDADLWAAAAIKIGYKILEDVPKAVRV